jgi:hypothetical protein
MTPEITEMLRNLYSASGGSVPPSAALLWNEAYTSAASAAESAHDSGGDFDAVSDAFNKTFAESLGWTQEEFEAFESSDLPFNSDGMLEYKQDIDVWEWMVRTHGR